MSGDVRILEPGQLEAPRGEIRFLFLSDRDLFSRRAGRLRHLSKGHSLGDYLNFLALLADAQQDALDQFPALALPDADVRARCREQGVPLFDTRSWQRDRAWQWGLQMILQEMQGDALPQAAHETITGLMRESDAALEQTAGRILTGELSAVSPHDLPLVSAALQVYWVRMASSMQEDVFGRPEQSGACPVCGSRPNAGIVRGSGPEQGLRYLSCSLCASEWHKVRLTCSSCEATSGLNYYTLEGPDSAVKAESCNDCNTYLKLLYLGKDPQMDATADDLATLGLDLLMAREGKSRGGPNLFFHPGESH